VNVHHGDDDGTPRTMKSPLLGTPNVKVVLRHFHRHCPREVCYGSLFGEALISRVLAMEEARWTQRFTWFGLPERHTLRP
jgi:hypothetical protein